MTGTNIFDRVTQVIAAAFDGAEAAAREVWKETEPQPAPEENSKAEYISLLGRTYCPDTDKIHRGAEKCELTNHRLLYTKVPAG